MNPPVSIWPGMEDWVRGQSERNSWIVTPAFAREGTLSRLAAAASLIDDSAVWLTRSDPKRQTDVARVSWPELDGQSLIVKRYRSNWKSRIKELLGRRRAERSLAVAFRLREAKIPTAEPVALVQPSRAGSRLPSFLLTREITGARRLRELWALEAGMHERELVLALAKVLGDLHEHELRHTDPQAK